MNDHLARFALAGVVTLTAAPRMANAGETESFWIPLGGDFEDPASWSGPVPDETVTAIFDVDEDLGPFIEFNADSPATTLQDYLAIEERVFAQLESEVQDKIEGLERTNFNRNWSAEWNPAEPGAGPFPFSLPEVRAVAEFMTSHRNIFFQYTIHSGGGGRLHKARANACRWRGGVVRGEERRTANVGLQCLAGLRRGRVRDVHGAEARRVLGDQHEVAFRL